ncbi:MAG: hypothetical protein HY799_04190 [Nitrosomonadales bacterium]|nr:hypothetical protein [Nitrosomonadales bacterium]
MSPPAIPFPDAPVSEWVGIRTDSASGLFAYRHLQAIGLLEFPDFGGGDMTSEQRRDALCDAINFQKPLAALAIFLGVVALEDFVRDFGARMADNTDICNFFPALVELRAQPIQRSADQAFKRLDTDPTGCIDPKLINDIFRKSLNVEPISTIEYPRLRDLALIRHTVAHHAAIIRPVDVQRFQYYILRPQQAINPPAKFVRETLAYLYQTGRVIEDTIRNRVFSVVLPSLEPEWWNTRPTKLIQLIEFFDFFGFIETAVGPVGYVEPGTPQYERMKADAAHIKEKLLARCIQELRNKFTA